MIVATTFSLYGIDVWEAAGPPDIKYDVIIYSVNNDFAVSFTFWHSAKHIGQSAQHEKKMSDTVR